MEPPVFDKVLIANRGEIALRIHHACKEMGISTVAVHSTADSDAMHVRLADESVCIGAAPASESYFNTAALLTAATITNADAIHPGYGLLSENAGFAEMVTEHGFVFIGPSADHIRMMSDKITAKDTMKRLGVPVGPGAYAACIDAASARRGSDGMGYPVLVKASGGGGGRGIKIAESADEIGTAFATAQSEAKAYFGNDEMYIEKYLGRPRHIEIQVLADSHGGVIHLGERD